MQAVCFLLSFYFGETVENTKRKARDPPWGGKRGVKARGKRRCGIGKCNKERNERGRERENERERDK